MDTTHHREMTNDLIEDIGTKWRPDHVGGSLGADGGRPTEIERGGRETTRPLENYIVKAGDFGHFSG